MPTDAPALSPLAKSIKPKLTKTPQTATEIMKKLGRSSGVGSGRAFTVLVQAGHARRHEDGRYSKVA